jgi:hypothetical protein
MGAAEPAIYPEQVYAICPAIEDLPAGVGQRQCRAGE